MIGITPEVTRLTLLGFVLLLPGCAPTELTAPCDPLAVERPVNIVSLLKNYLGLM